MNALKLSLLGAASATLIAASAATAAPLSSGGPDLLVNGGFETGSFAPWVSGGSGFNSVQASGANTGTHAASMGCVGATCVVAGPTGITGTGTLTQTLTLQPGIYQFQYFVTNPSGVNQIGASVGNNVLTNTSLGNIPYTQFSFITAVSGGSTNVVVGIRQDPSFMHLDDVALNEVDDGAGNNLGAATQTVAAQVSRDVMDNVLDHLTNSNSGMMTVNNIGNYRTYAGFFGDGARWNLDSRGHREGVLLGAEWAPNNDWNVGLVFAHAKSRFVTQTLFTDNDGLAQENLGGVYASWTPDCWPGYVSGIIGYGVNSNRLMRSNDFGAVGAYVSTKQVFGGIEAGYNWQAMPQVMLTPFVRFDGASLSQDSYWEYSYLSGSLVPAWVDSKNPNIGRMVLGVRGAADINTPGTFPWHLTAKLGWQSEFNRRRSVTFSETTGPVSFSGTTFGAVPAANSLVTGAGLDIPVAKDWTISFDYNGDFGSGQTIHEGMFGIRFTF